MFYIFVCFPTAVSERTLSLSLTLSPSQFTMYDAGANPKKMKGEQEAREELGVVQYDKNVLGNNGPRKMQCAPATPPAHTCMCGSHRGSLQPELADSLSRGPGQGVGSADLRRVARAS